MVKNIRQGMKTSFKDPVTLNVSLALIISLYPAVSVITSFGCKAAWCSKIPAGFVNVTYKYTSKMYGASSLLLITRG